MVQIKSILIKQGVPRRDHKCNVVFGEDVVIIGGETVPLAPPAGTNEELTFDYNPPATPGLSAKGGRKGTMRIKGTGGGKGISPYAAALAAEEERQKQEGAAQVTYLQAGYMKLLKESGMKSSWTKRYITLTATSLAYHRSADAFKPLKTFDITDECYVREISQRTGVIDCRNSLEIVFGRNKSIVLKGTSQREATEWITAICAAVDALGGGVDDDEFDFVDEDEFEFVDEEAAPAAATSASSTPFSEPSPFDGGAAAADSREVSEESSGSFEWVDEDAAKPAAPKEDDSAKKKAEEEAAAKKKEEEEAAERKIAEAGAQAAAKKKAEEEAAAAKKKAEVEMQTRAKEKASADEVARKKKAEAEAQRKQQEAKAAEKKKEEEARAKKAQEAAEAERKRKEAFAKRKAPVGRATTVTINAPPQSRPGSRPHGLSGASGLAKTRSGNKVNSLLKMFEQP